MMGIPVEHSEVRAMGGLATVERYGPGEDANEFVPGDFILTHRHIFDAWLISQAERRRFRGRQAPYAH